MASWTRTTCAAPSTWGCPHERVRARRPAGRDLWTLHLRQHGQDVPGEDGRRGQRPRRPHRPGLQGLRQRGQDRLQDVRAALKTWGDKMTKAEIDDIFGEFEIDEDYGSRPRTSLACSSPSRRS